MPDYIQKLEAEEQKRYEGYEEHKICINKSQAVKDFENANDTVKKVNDAVAELTGQKDKNSAIQNIVDPETNKLKDKFVKPILDKLVEKVKNALRPLNMNEVKDTVMNVAKEAALNVSEEDSSNCIEDNYDTNFFLSSNFNTPPITPSITGNLKKLHSSIIVPIMKYYKGTNEIPDDGKCRFKLSAGLLSKSDVVSKLLGTIENPHAYGKAIDFFIEGLDTAKIFKDIAIDKKIPIEYGVIFNKGGSIHISLPYGNFRNFILSRDVSVTPSSTGFNFDGKTLGKLVN